MKANLMMHIVRGLRIGEYPTDWNYVDWNF